MLTTPDQSADINIDIDSFSLSKKPFSGSPNLSMSPNTAMLTASKPIIPAILNTGTRPKPSIEKNPLNAEPNAPILAMIGNIALLSNGNAANRPNRSTVKKLSTGSGISMSRRTCIVSKAVSMIVCKNVLIPPINPATSMFSKSFGTE